MTTNSLYLILCLAGSLTLLAFTQKPGNDRVAEAASTAGKSLVHERPAMATGDNSTATTGRTTDNSTTGNSTTHATSSTSTDLPLAPVGSNTQIVQPGDLHEGVSTTTMDIPTTGSTYVNPNN